MRLLYIFAVLFIPIQFVFSQAITLNGIALNPPITPGAPTTCNDDYEFRNLNVGLPTVAGNCITMTNGALVNGASAVWICTPLDLTIDFNITFDANFGTNVASGDGIAFVLDGDPDVEMGGDGGYMGYHSINPSVAVEFDTWPDADINCDHAEIHQGGIFNNISNPVPLKTCCGTVKDGLDHTVCISWDASTSTLRALFDGNLVGQYQGSLATYLGTNSPIWGITTGCGAGGQVHRICNVSMNNSISTVASCPSCTPPTISVPSNSFSVCNGEALNIPISSSGGTTSYCWSASDNPSVSGETLNDQTTSTVTDTLLLTAGFSQTVTYTVIAESNGCISSPISFDVVVSNGLNLIITDPDTVCSPSSVDLTASSVTAGSDPGTLSYWQDIGATIPIVDPTNISSSGTYYISLSNGSCSDTASVDVVILQNNLTPNATVSSNYNGFPISCFGASDGSVQTNTTGGVSPYLYNWSTGSSNVSLSSLGAGTYYVTVTDQQNCVQVDSVVVIEPDTLDVLLNAVSNVCSGGSLGSIDISPLGGSGNFAYQWSNGATSQDINGLVPSAYSLTVTDGNGCSNQFGQFNVIQNGPVVITDSTVNIQCFGNVNGAIYVTVDTGIPPFNFNWSNGATSAQISGLSAGSYSVTVSDSTGCSASLTNLIVSQPTIILVQTDTFASNSCAGQNNGYIGLSVSGGVSPYTYIWSTGDTTSFTDSLYSGIYDVTVTDANGCTASAKSLFIDSIAPINVQLNVVNNISCNAANDGQIDVDVTGGVGNFTYNWSNGATTQDLTNLSAGSYTLIVADSNNCTSTLGPISILEPDSLQVQDSIVDVLCNGDATGAIYLQVLGGSSPYTYNWSNGTTTQDLINITAGSYQVTISDSSLCVVQLSNLIISQPSALLAQVDSISQLDCFGDQSGYISVSYSGATPPYIFLWSNGVTSDFVDSLGSGLYAVTLTDSVGCSVILDSISIDSVAPLQISLSSLNSISCNQANDGSIDIDVTGGVGGYTYQWSNGATTQDLNGLSVGSYSITASDTNGCESFLGPLTITQPDSLVVLDSVVNVRCFGEQNGAIFLHLSGGTLPYTFNWSNGATTQNIQNLFTGNYSVTVTDSATCVVILSSLSITQPSLLLVQTDTIAQNLCAGQGTGYIGLDVSGSVSPYSFSWSTGDTTTYIDSLYSGAYDVTVTDANGCTASAKSLFIDSIPPILPIVDSVQNNTCNGSNDAFIAISVSGGTGALSSFTISWNNGDSTFLIDSLLPGTYSATILDSLNCSATLGPITITEPAILSISLDSLSDNLCYGDSMGLIDLSVQGGTQPYTFNWNSGQSTEDISGLVNGVYSFTVVDDNMCMDSITGLSIQSPDSLVFNVDSVVDVSCFGANDGSIVTTTTGGVYPYTYLWNNASTDSTLANISGGLYSITLTDNNACTQQIDSIFVFEPAAILFQLDTIIGGLCFEDSLIQINTSIQGGTPGYTYVWSNGATDSSIIVSNYGSYSVTVTDLNNCSDSILAIDIIQSPALSISIDSTSNVSCFGDQDGYISIGATGGLGPLQISWSNGDASTFTDSLSGGFYSVTITDSVGCVSSQDSIFINEQPALLVNQDSLLNIACFGDSTGYVSVNVSGGLPLYQYQWSNGASSSSISNLPAGQYTLTVTDAALCIFDSFQVDITQPTLLAFSIDSIADITCFGDQNGYISTQASGGTSPYSYIWSNGDTANDIDSLNQGVFSVTIIDANGCTDSIGPLTINEPALLQTSIDSIAMNQCFGDQQGFISVVNTGGTLPITYQWSNGSSTSFADSLSGGLYAITVTDSLGCQDLIDSISIDEPNSLQYSLDSIVDVLCFGDSTGLLTVSSSGGNAPISYLWSNGQTSSTIQTLPASSYSLTLTDAQGCVLDTLQFLIDQPNPIQLISDSISNILCNGDSSALIYPQLSGGVAPYSFSWSNGGVDSIISNLGPGVYQLTLTDANGCQWVSSSYPINEPTLINITIDSFSNVTCHGDADGNVYTQVIGGTPGYTYLWSSGQTTDDLVNISGGAYQLLVVDSNACQDSITIQIYEPDSLVIQLDTLINESCAGQNDGVVQVQGIGGNQPLNYVWSNGETINQINTLSAGTYVITITDSLQCQVSDTFLIDDTPTIQVSSSIIDSVSCNGFSDGTISLVIAGGAGAYTYQWSNGQTDATIGSLVAGAYTITITDSIGCFIIDSSWVVDQPDSLIVNSTISDILCFGDDNGQINIIASGGTLPYVYQWTSGLASSSTQSGLQPNLYQVTISDYNNCIWIEDSLLITEPDSFYYSILAENVRCFGEQNGLLTATAFGGTADQNQYNYLWSTGLQTDSLINLGPGFYSVTITDSLGCQLIGLDTVYEPDELLINIDPIVPLEGCFGEPNGVLVASSSGGNGQVLYQWSTGDNSPQISNLSASIYVITITDSLGCIAIDSSSIGIPVIPQLNAGINTVGVLLDTLNYGQTVLIFTQPDQSNQGVDYEWTEINGQTTIIFDNAFAASSNVTCQPLSSSLFELELLATSQDGCQDTAYIDLFVIVNELLGIPNAFSPNSDGLNDLFRPANLDPQFIDVFRIFNRFGQLVYDGDQNNNEGWNGRFNGVDQPTEGYIYLIEYTMPGEDIQKVRGEILLIR